MSTKSSYEYIEAEGLGIHVYRDVISDKSFLEIEDMKEPHIKFVEVQMPEDMAKALGRVLKRIGEASK